MIPNEPNLPRETPSIVQSLTDDTLNWSLGETAGALSERDRHLLQALGAGLIGMWAELPREIQKQIFFAATTAHTRDTDQFRGDLARFLHDHKAEEPEKAE